MSHLFTTVETDPNWKIPSRAGPEHSTISQLISERIQTWLNDPIVRGPHLQFTKRGMKKLISQAHPIKLQARPSEPTPPRDARTIDSNVTTSETNPKTRLSVSAYAPQEIPPRKRQPMRTTTDKLADESGDGVGRVEKKSRSKPTGCTLPPSQDDDLAIALGVDRLRWKETHNDRDSDSSSGDTPDHRTRAKPERGIMDLLFGEIKRSPSPFEKELNLLLPKGDTLAHSHRSPCVTPFPRGYSLTPQRMPTSASIDMTRAPLRTSGDSHSKSLPANSLDGIDMLRLPSLDGSDARPGRPLSLDLHFSEEDLSKFSPEELVRTKAEKTYTWTTPIQTHVCRYRQFQALIPGLVNIEATYEYNHAAPIQTASMYTLGDQSTRSLHDNSVPGAKFDTFNFVVWNRSKQSLEVSVGPDAPTLQTDLLICQDASQHLSTFTMDLKHLSEWDSTAEVFSTEFCTIRLTCRFVPTTGETKDDKTDQFGFDVVENSFPSLYSLYVKHLQLESTSTPVLLPILREIPIEFSSRVSLWYETARTKYNLPEELYDPMYYRALFHKGVKSQAIMDQIDRDLPRTFPHHPAYRVKGRKKLKRLLVAFAAFDPAVSYCQGLNTIFATCLLVAQEHTAFILGVTLVHYILGDYHSESMLGSRIDQQAMEILLSKFLPKLEAHFQEQQVKLAAISMKWFITIFAGEFPFLTVLKFWDVIFSRGRIGLIKIILAIFIHNHNDLFREFSECKAFLDNQSLVQYEVEGILDEARRISDASINAAIEEATTLLSS